MNRARVKDYTSAEKWLLGARSKIKNERTLYERGVKLVRLSPTEISVVLTWWGFKGPVITYRNDGTTILHHSGPLYQSVRRIYMEYVKDLTMVVRKGRVIISLPSDGRTPSKITKCRSCKGVGTIPRDCYGPTYRCWDDSCEEYLKTRPLRQSMWNLPWGSEERNELEKQIDALEHKHDTCKHGYRNRHIATNDRYDCYRCNTTGQVDYGNKQMGRVWESGIDIGIDSNGNYMEV